jgi:L-aspartate oxidase
MTEGAGVLRSAASLAGAAAALERLAGAADPDGAGVAAWETANLLLVARVLVAAARARTETRGCHWREDRPDRDDVRWRRHLLVGLPAGSDGSTLDMRATASAAFPPTVAGPDPVPHHASAAGNAADAPHAHAHTAKESTS